MPLARRVVTIVGVVLQIVSIKVGASCERRESTYGSYGQLRSMHKVSSSSGSC